MGITHWDKGTDGNIICNPLTGVESAPMLNGMVGLVRLEYFVDQSETKSAVQLAITVNEVTRLIRELQVLEQQLHANLAADKPAGKVS